jgi:VWFA-related protein
MMRARVGLVGVLLAGIALEPLGAAPRQQAAQQTAQPTDPSAQQPNPQTTFRSRVDSVLVDVSVTDKQGRPVTDLTKADFDVRESNKPQTIETFKYIALDDTPVDPRTVPEILSMEDQQRETARDDARIIVIFLDDYHTHLSSSMRVRGLLANFVRGLNPHDLVAIATPLMPVTLITFSHDLDGIASELMTFVGRKYNYAPKYPVEEQLSFLDPQTIEQTRNTVVVSALQAVCAYMGTLRDGRKTLLYVSEGMTGDVQNGTIMSSTSRGAPSAVSNNLVSQDLNQDLIEIFAAASRSNTAIYAMDPRGLAATAYEMGDPGSSQVSPTADYLLLTNQLDVLRTIADQTGGRAIVGNNDPKNQLQQMLRDTSGYYLLSYTSTEKPRDGKFHAIVVRVNRKDLEIRARKGYYAYSADEVAKALAPPKPRPPAAVTEALDSVEEPGRDHPFRIWAGAAKGPDGKATVTMAWESEPAPVSGAAAVRAKTDTIDHVTLNARSVSGEQVFDGDLKPDPKASTLAGSVTFDVPPGSVRLRVTALSASGLRIDTINRDVDVPDFTAVGAFITTPAVFSAHTAREMQQIRTAAVPVPTPVRVFSRTERLLLRFQAYGPGGTTPKMTMRLLNQLGQRMIDLPAPTAVGPSGFEEEIGLGSLAAGSYVFEIDADSGGTTAQALVAVNITG